MKTLLAIINEPQESKEFLRYVAEMAVDFNTKLHILHTRDTIDYPVGTAGTTGVAVTQVHHNQEVLLKNAKKTLTGYMEELKSKIPDELSVSYTIRSGVASQLAIKLVRGNEADMVVMEGQEESNFWTRTSGNMEIVGSVDCPVWIIPNPGFYRSFKEIIYATDYKEEDIEGLKKLIALTGQFSPNITALHITDNSGFEEKVKRAGFQEMFREKVNYLKLKVEILNEGSKSDQAGLLNDFAILRKADLIVVLKENKSFFEVLFNTDQAERIIKKSMLPVLFFHEKE